MEGKRRAGGLQTFKQDSGSFASAEDFPGIKDFNADQLLIRAEVQGHFIGQPNATALMLALEQANVEASISGS